MSVHDQVKKAIKKKPDGWFSMFSELFVTPLHQDVCMYECLCIWPKSHMNTDLTVVYATNPKPKVLDVGLGLNRTNVRFANCMKEEERLSCINHLSVEITSDHFDFYI